MSMNVVCFFFWGVTVAGLLIFRWSGRPGLWSMGNAVWGEERLKLPHYPTWLDMLLGVIYNSGCLVFHLYYIYIYNIHIYIYINIFTCNTQKVVPSFSIYIYIFLKALRSIHLSMWKRHMCPVTFTITIYCYCCHLYNSASYSYYYLYSLLLYASVYIYVYIHT